MHFLCRYTEKNEPTAAVNLTRYPFFFSLHIFYARNCICFELGHIVFLRDL